MNHIQEHCKTYAVANDLQAVASLFFTCLAQVFACLLIYSPLPIVGWAMHTLLMMRFFILFHDMAHYSFFKKVLVNRIFGEIIGLYMIYPFSAWRNGHNHHHHNFGNLDGGDVSQTILFTKQEYESYPLWKRIVIRTVREPIVFFPITVPFLWIFGTLAMYVQEYKLYNPIILVKISGFLLFYYFGCWQLYLSYYLSIVLGTILFHTQHSINMPYRQRVTSWNREEASIQGSTFLEIPYLLKFFTNGIEYHHIHHLNVMVPSYNIEKCHTSLDTNQDNWEQSTWHDIGVNKVSMDQLVDGLWNVMLDEESNMIVPFSYSLW